MKPVESISKETITIETMPIRAPAPFRIIAHSGSSAYAPENTKPAFELAKAMGVKEVELDAQLSTDGVVVLCHDDTLVRYGHGDRVVEQMSADALLSLDMGSWFSPHQFAGVPMMTLEELLAGFAGDFVFHIELKGKAEGLAPAVAEVVEKQNAWGVSIITSFAYEQLERMRAVAPDGRLGWLVQDSDENTLERARELALFQLCPRVDLLTGEMVALGKSVASEVRAWGVNGKAQEVRSLIARD